jgi:osmoprotectant transport system permease protein
MGMNGPQVLAKVELPLATGLLMDGVRLAAVQVIATATIAGLVAGGGLGAIIVDGYGRQNQAEVVGGSICVVLLALSVESGMALLQRRADPLRTVRERSRVAAA